MSAQEQLAVVIRYVAVFDSVSLFHTQRLRCNVPQGDAIPAPGTDPSTFNLETAGVGGVRGSVDAETGVSEYVAAMVNNLGSSLSVVTAEIYQYPDGLSGNSVFIAGLDTTDTSLFPELTGQRSNNGSDASQEQYTFKTSAGKSAWLKLMENAPEGTNRKEAFADINSEAQGYVNYVLGANCWVQFPGGAYAVAFDSLYRTESNEVLYRKRYR